MSELKLRPPLNLTFSASSLKAYSPGLKSGASTDRKDTKAEAYATEPSAPKGGIDFARVTARLKPCPDTKPTADSVLNEFIMDLVR
jgi:hypothetical protein